MQRILVTTEDGSSSVFVPDLQETFHSKFGSIQESQHVFIQAGLGFFSVQDRVKISILEVGLGTGLNALLTLLTASKHQLPVHYYAIEAFPLEKEIYSNLNYNSILHNSSNILQQLHLAKWNEEVEITPGFSIFKNHSLLQDAMLPTGFDLIYYDAFAPRVQPELWTVDILKKMYESLKAGGVLVTYCAKGEVKRNLKSAGFRVETLPGPKGKREMTRAIK